MIRPSLRTCFLLIGSKLDNPFKYLLVHLAASILVATEMRLSFHAMYRNIILGFMCSYMKLQVNLDYFNSVLKMRKYGRLNELIVKFNSVAFVFLIKTCLTIALGR